MRLGGALVPLLLILQSFSEAVPSYVQSHRHLDKRQGNLFPTVASNPQGALNKTTSPGGDPWTKNPFQPASTKESSLSPGKQAFPDSKAGGLGSPTSTFPGVGGVNSSSTASDMGNPGQTIPGLGGVNPSFGASGMGDTGLTIPGLGGVNSSSSASGMGDTGLTIPGLGGANSSSSASGMGDTGLIIPGLNGANSALNSTANQSLLLLQKILNTTLARLPGLESLADQVEQLMNKQLQAAVNTANQSPDLPGSQTNVTSGVESSVNATSNNTVSVSGQVEMNGTDANGRPCETYGYVTLSATTLSTLSGLFQSLVRLEKSVSSDGSKTSLSIIEKARAQVSFTMFSVVKLTATPAVTGCRVPPSQTTFSSQIQANVSMCAASITKLERDLASGTISGSQTSAMGADASINANSTLNQTVGTIAPSDAPGGSNGLPTLNNGTSSPDPTIANATANPYPGTTGPQAQTGGFPGLQSQDGSPASSMNNPVTLGNNTQNPLGTTGNGSSLVSPQTVNASSPGFGNPADSSGTTPFTSTSSGSGDSSGGSPGNMSSSTQSVSVNAFAEVKASFAAAAQVTTGLITSQPSKGTAGIHIGATVNAEINVNIQARVSVQSSIIDNFLQNVNGGSGAQNHDAIQSPSIQNKNGLGILQDIAGGSFGSFLSDFMNGGGGSDASGFGSSSQSSGSGFSGPSGTGNSSAVDPQIGKPYGSDTGAGSVSTTPGGNSSAVDPQIGKPYGSNPGTTSSSYPTNSTQAANPGGPGSGFGSGLGGDSPGGSTVSGFGQSPNGTVTSADGTGNPGPGSSNGPTTSGPGNPMGSSNAPDSSGGKPGGMSSSPFGSGSTAGASNCVCQPDSSTHLRIRSLENQLAHVHRIIQKRGLAEL